MSAAAQAEALRRGALTALEILDEMADPEDAVIRSWLALEQAAAFSGAPRRPADSPTEFARSLLARTGADRAAVRTLLQLYHRARFSSHPVGLAEIRQARACVLGLSHSLAGYENALRRSVGIRSRPRPSARVRVSAVRSSGPPIRTLLLIASGLGALTFVGWAFGLEWPSALLVALGLVAVLGLRRIPATNHQEDWPPPPEVGFDRGVRREVTRLSWSLHGYESRVERPSLIRLRAVADRRLGLRGLHLDDPADGARCQALLGPLAHRVVTAGPRAHVTFEQFAASLVALEDLGNQGTGVTVSTSAPLPVADVSRLGQAVLAEIATVVVGMRGALEVALAAILAGGHVLFEDVPGLGKTLAARSLATTLGLEFRRLQCTPDLLPADITGSYVFDPAEGRFAFRPGPVFTGLLLADEINRTAPKTQSALLEAMAERQVTVEGTSFTLEQPFHVLATSNPVEYEGTYPLPEAQLDRFMVRLAVGYPDRGAEADVLTRRLDRRSEEASVRAIVDAPTVRGMQSGIETVAVDPDIVAYCVALAAGTRAHPAVEVGASPRGSLALLLVSRARAVLAGRDFVLPEDVKAVAVSALAHRITLNPQTWATGVQAKDVIATVLAQVPGPAAVPDHHQP